MASSLSSGSALATHLNRVVLLMPSATQSNYTASTDSDSCSTTSSTPSTEPAEDEYASESGALCHICTNFRDLFAEQLKLVDQLVESFVTAQVYNIRGSLSSGTVDFDFFECSLHVVVDLHHRFPIQHRIESSRMPRKAVDAMRLALRIYLAEEAAEFCGGRLYDVCFPILRLLEETTAYVDEYRNKLSEEEYAQYPEWATRRINTKSSALLDKEAEDEPSTKWVYEEVPTLLGATPKQICERIAPSAGLLRIVHCESVIRSDLQRAFEDRQAVMRDRLNRLSLATLDRSIPREHRRGHGNVTTQKKEAIDYLLKPRITFHGTRKETVRSIVRHGFLKPGDVHPGTGEALPVRCGSTYGRGIYSSPDPSFSLSYTEYAEKTTASDIAGQKLIVCATIMGRANSIFRGDNWWDLSKPREGSDSHVGNNGLEYIVFDSAQILPCYVVHLNWGEQPSRTLEQVHTRAYRNSLRPDMPLHLMAPGDKQRIKQEKLAQARKFFAYGYGPVSGNKIIVEDIASSDDDEEEYGEYQASRIDNSDTFEPQESIWDWKPTTLLGKKGADQYGKERNME
jgi:hypothetical protein